MKHTVTALIILISTTVFSQKIIEKTIGEFKELKVYDLIEVELIKFNTDIIVITGENSEEVQVNNKNGTLKLKMSLGKIFNGNNTKIKLFYTNLDIVDVNEGAKVYSKDTIKQFEIDLKAQEGGTIDLKLDTNYAKIKANTGGRIKAEGVSKSQKITLSTGGVFKGKTLKSEKAEVIIKAAGEAYVNSSKLLDIKVRAGGDVFVYGEPETVIENLVLGGRVKRMKEVD